MEDTADIKSKMVLVPMQPGDILMTYVHTTQLEQGYGFKLSAPLCDGLKKFAECKKCFTIYRV